MLEVEFANAWMRDDWKLGADAKTFWQKIGLVSAEERERRVGELCTVAYHQGQVVGVATATLTIVPQVRARLAMYRCAVDPDFRRQDMAERMSGRIRTILEAWSADNPQEKVLGMGAIIQAAELRRKSLEPIWHDWGTELVMCGYTQRGEQIRISWFPHARFEDPTLAQASPEGMTQ